MTKSSSRILLACLRIRKVSRKEIRGLRSKLRPPFFGLQH